MIKIQKRGLLSLKSLNTSTTFPIQTFTFFGVHTFPSPDPIPLPAPVLIFKLLHITVLSLHFVAVYLVLGGLLVGALWNLFGRARQNQAMVSGSNEIIGCLPTTMTYLINLGIPPLLFAQVLYGSFLYTSSVLMGVYWISVIFLVILAYSSMYAGNSRADNGRSWWALGFLALILGVGIAKIYSSNMTLMLRPGVWLEMYRAHPHGQFLPSGDPTIIPRWLFMLAGSLTVGGLGLVVLGIWKKHSSEVKSLMVGHGGLVALIGIAAQTALAFRVFATQPEAVRTQLAASAIYHPLALVWLGLAGVVLALAFVAMVRREKATGLLSWTAGLVSVLLTAATTTYRDGIRDTTLLLNGFDVWNQKVVENWPIITLFLVSFVVGVIILIWLISVALKAKYPLPIPPLQPNPTSKEISR